MAPQRVVDEREVSYIALDCLFLRVICGGADHGSVNGLGLTNEGFEGGLEGSVAVWGSREREERVLRRSDQTLHRERVEIEWPI